jgi:hydroxymethylpyrimidine pyrophosphatase-like HAD family hydrolase
MPEKKLVKQHYLSAHVVEKLDEIYEGQNEDYLIYSGFEKGDFCFYRPHRFSKVMTEYLELMMTLVEEPWQALETFTPLKHQSFPLIKCIGTKEHMEEVALYLQKLCDVSVSCIKDPLSKDGFYVNLITDRLATKGKALAYLRTLQPKGALFIAAGDDRNDISLLDAADIAIGMQGAPSDVLKHADIIAPSADEMGIIQGLELALKGRGK